MLFTSYDFLGFILLIFLLYYLIPKKFQWVLLLAGSYIFYFIAGYGYLPYIAAVTVSVYLSARRMESLREQSFIYLKAHQEELSRESKKVYKARAKQKQCRMLLLGLLAALGILAVVKYTNFVIFNINSLFHLGKINNQLTFLDIALPMGISFYTFQAVGYLIDVYRGNIRAERNFFRFALFVSFFPQLVQGPISRFHDLAPDLFAEHEFNRKAVSYGLQRILWGYFKKLVIADRILLGVNELIRNPDIYKGAYVFVGMLFYAMELYADFTGGIDITIGVAEALGIQMSENFCRPFFSKSVKEYWRRWHITMGTWFTDYIFYPISVCGFMRKISKWSRMHMGQIIGKRVPVYLSSFAVWLATGIWHGASWNFVAWGLGNWIIIMVSQELEPLYHRFHNYVHLENNRMFHLFQVIRTVLLMSCIRTFDCYSDVLLTFKMFGSMFTEKNWNILWNGSLLNIGLGRSDYMILLLGFVILVTVSLLQRDGKVRDRIAGFNYLLRVFIWFGLFLSVVVLGIYGIGYDANQFIYNQF